LFGVGLWHRIIGRLHLQLERHVCRKMSGSSIWKRRSWFRILFQFLLRGRIVRGSGSRFQELHPQQWFQQFQLFQWYPRVQNILFVLSVGSVMEVSVGRHWASVSTVEK